MIEVGGAPAYFVMKLTNWSHLLVVDLLHTIRVGMVVRVKPGSQKHDWNPLGRVAVVIAPVVDLFQIRWIVHLEIKLERFRQRGVRIDSKVVELCTDTIRT